MNLKILNENISNLEEKNVCILRNFKYQILVVTLTISNKINIVLHFQRINKDVESRYSY